MPLVFPVPCSHSFCIVSGQLFFNHFFFNHCSSFISSGACCMQEVFVGGNVGGVDGQGKNQDSTTGLQELFLWHRVVHESTFLQHFLPPSPRVQHCTAADNAESLPPASWVNRLLSVNTACLWHSSLLHTIWFQGKFSPSMHAHCFCCSKEEISRFYPSEVLPSY